MRLEDIHEMWSQDARIDKRDLNESSRNTPLLHQKYLQIWSNERMKLVALEMDQKKLLKKKWLYYNGKMTQEEIEVEGWDYDPFHGLKVLKGEMDYYYDADTDIQASEMKIQLQKEKINIIKEIIDNLKWRHQNIRNIIEWSKFENGM